MAGGELEGKIAAELKASRLTARSLRLRNAMTDRKNERLQAQLRRSKGECADLGARLASEREDNDSLQNQVDELDAMLRSETQQNASLEEQVDALQAERCKLNSQLLGSTREIKDLQHRVCALVDEKNVLWKQLDDLEAAREAPTPDPRTTEQSPGGVPAFVPRPTKKRSLQESELEPVQDQGKPRRPPSAAPVGTCMCASVDGKELLGEDGLPLEIDGVHCQRDDGDVMVKFDGLTRNQIIDSLVACGIEGGKAKKVWSELRKMFDALDGKHDNPLFSWSMLLRAMGWSRDSKESRCTSERSKKIIQSMADHGIHVWKITKTVGNKGTARPVPKRKAPEV